MWSLYNNIGTYIILLVNMMDYHVETKCLASLYVLYSALLRVAVKRIGCDKK